MGGRAEEVARGILLGDQGFEFLEGGVPHSGGNLGAFVVDDLRENVVHAGEIVGLLVARVLHSEPSGVSRRRSSEMHEYAKRPAAYAARL